jgi:hypothetical protein
VPAADVETTERAPRDRFSTFGVFRDWVSDRGSHFKNDFVRIMHEQNRPRYLGEYCKEPTKIPGMNVLGVANEAFLGLTVRVS